MLVKTINLSVLVFILLAPPQEPTLKLGCPSELRGLRKVYIDIHVDKNLNGYIVRDDIVEEIGKNLPELIFVSTSDEAEVQLQLTLEKMPDSRYERSIGSVITQGGDGRSRLLWRLVNTRRVSLGRQAESFAAEFVKSYKAAGLAMDTKGCLDQDSAPSNSIGIPNRN